MLKKITSLIPQASSSEKVRARGDDIALGYKKEVFDPLSKTQYLRNPGKDFNKKCFEMNSVIRNLFNVRLGSLKVKSLKPLSVEKFEQGMKKYFFGEYGIVTEQDKDLKRMYQIKRALNRRKERNQSYKIDTKNAKIIIKRRFISNKRIKIKNTNIDDVNNRQSNNKNEVVGYIEKKTKKNNTDNNSNNTNHHDTKFALFSTGIKYNKIIKRQHNNNNKDEQNCIKLTKNIQLKQSYPKLNKKLFRSKGRNIQSRFNNDGIINTSDAFSIDNLIKSTSDINNNRYTKGHRLRGSSDGLVYSQLFQTQTQRLKILNATYSSGFGINISSNNPNQKTDSHRTHSMHKLQLSLSEASNHLIPKLQQMNWTKYLNHPLANLKTQDDKEKEKDLENLLDIKVDFNNKKNICDELKKRMNNKEDSQFRRAVIKFANGLGNINPTTSLKLKDIITDDYFKQTRTCKYSKITESQESHNNIMNNLRCKMSKHYCHLSRLMANYSKIKNKIFVS